MINNIADIKQTSFDAKENALVLHGTGSQMALAEWLFPLLDLPTSELVVTQQLQKATRHEYQVDPDDVVRVGSVSAIMGAPPNTGYKRARIPEPVDPGAQVDALHRRPRRQI